MRNHASLVAASFSALLVAAHHAAASDHLYKLSPTDGASGDAFGEDVAISGTTAIVGAAYNDDQGICSGSAYLFSATTGQQLLKLLPDDGAANDSFGDAVDICGTTAIVGAYGDSDNGPASGSAYLFDATNGQQLRKLLPDDGASPDYFGLSVAICGTTAIVGANHDSDFGQWSGSAYLFDTTTGQQVAKLLPDDAAEWDFFGLDVDISGTTAIVSAPLNDDNGENSGSAYLFDTTTGQQIAKLLPDDGEAWTQFGVSVAIDGRSAVVGAHFDGDNGPRSGSAYLFDAITGQQIAKLLPSDGQTDDNFGESVAISGTTIIVGAPGDADNGPLSGSAYLFDVATGRQIAKLLPDDGAAEEYFGRSVALGGTTALVGADLDDDQGPGSGSAYLYDIVTLGFTGDCNANGLNDFVDLFHNHTSNDCDTNGVPDECQIAGNTLLSAFPLELSEPIAGVDIRLFLGAPDDNFLGLGDGQLTYVLDGVTLVDGSGPDFNVYEVNFGGDDFQYVEVSVSADGSTFTPIAPEPGAPISIPGDEAHTRLDLRRSYDLASVGLSAVHHIRITGTHPDPPGGTAGFDLDAVGLAHTLSDLDLDGDGALDACESPCPGDLDGDNDTDVFDFATLADDFGCDDD
jgi:hypothetical protein